ncbi:MAG: hypothetical protein ACXACR_07260, partial [Candidatus Hodarchaeales archaeon]
MSEGHYLNVRKLISERRIEEAEKIQEELSSSSQRILKEENYWFNLIQSEIKKYKDMDHSAKRNLEIAYRLSKEIELTDNQMSSLNGRIGIIHYRLKNFEKGVLFFQKALNFLSEDMGRQNYYRRMILNCYYNLKDETNYFKTLEGSLDQIFQKSMEDNWNTNMDF